MRIRSLKPEWLEDERLAAATDAARLLSVVLILLADDYGNARAHTMFLASRAWPYDESPETLARVSGALSELERIGFVVVYEVGGQRYYHIRNWTKHQKISHPGKPIVPGPPEALPKPSRGAPEALRTDQDQDQDQDHNQDQDRAAPEGLAIDVGEVAAAYASFTCNSDLSPDASQWTQKQQAAVITMKRWAQNNGGLGALGAELSTLAAEARAADGWLLAKPVHVWADHLGTGGKRPAGSSKGPVPASADFTQDEDDFPELRDGGADA